MDGKLFIYALHNPDIFGYVGAFEPVGGVVNTGSGETLYVNRGYLLPELVKEGRGSTTSYTYSNR